MSGTILPTHRCFDDALDYIELRLREGAHPDSLILVHGICLAPEGPHKDKPFAHAWVEHEGRVVQSGLLDGERIFYSVPSEDFAEMLRPQEFTRYTLRQALAQNLASGHYGPWEERYIALCGGRTLFEP